MHDTKQFLFNWHTGVGVEDSILVAVCQHYPLNAGDAGISDDLAVPFAFIEVSTERLGFDEETGLTMIQKGVVHRIVGGLVPVLPVYFT